MEKLYHERLRQVILYGSWVRGEASIDSDIDILVVLEGDIQPGKEIDQMIDIITDLNLQYDVLLSVVPLSEEKYKTANNPFLMNVRKEGVQVLGEGFIAQPRTKAIYIRHDTFTKWQSLKVLVRLLGILKRNE